MVSILVSFARALGNSSAEKRRGIRRALKFQKEESYEEESGLFGCGNFGTDFPFRQRLRPAEDGLKEVSGD
jgi:phosphoglycerate dehydrogenase-like enzyme